MGKLGFFEVWVSVGFGMQPGPEFNELAQALRYIGARLEDGAFAIRLPNGTWLENPSGGILFSRLGDTAINQLEASWTPPARGRASLLAPLGVTKGGYWLGSTALRRRRKKQKARVANPAFRPARCRTVRGLEP